MGYLSSLAAATVHYLTLKYIAFAYGESGKTFFSLSGEGCLTLKEISVLCGKKVEI
jgi:uncharacterized membrane protein YkgB